MTRRVALWSALVLALATGVSLRAESLRIVPIASDNNVVVTFELANAYTDDVRQAIASGLRTTFTYEIDLRMVVPTWVDRTIASAVVSISDQYDNLTRRHSLAKTVDGRVIESMVTEDEAVVRQWLTSVSRMPIVGTSKLDPNRDYYVRISAVARPRSGSFIGWANAVTGQARFTFIP